MSLIANLKVGTKLMTLVVALLLCSVVVAGIGIVEMRKIDAQADMMYEYDLLALRAAKEANIQLIMSSRSLVNMIFAEPGDLDAAKQRYAGYLQLVRDELEKIRTRLTTPEGEAAFKEATDSFEAIIPLNEEILPLMGSSSPQQIFQAISKVRDEVNRADDAMSALGKVMADEAYERSLETTETAHAAFIIICAMLGAALLLGGVLGMLIGRAIAPPLVSISRKAALVAEGDLSQDFALARKDELGALAASLDQMVANLRERIGEAEQKSLEAQEQSERAREAMTEAQAAKEKAEEGQRAILTAAENVEQVVDRLSAATQQLSAQVEESSRGTDMQRERVASSATAMDEMNSTVLEVARNAGVAAEASNSSRNNAQQGQEIVLQSVEAISAVQSDAVALKENMESLGKQAEDIGNIMTVISDIADQTNLLALNAAIEAARAGEAGRGFAVVADEVRKLAEKTMQATKEVGDAIHGIQSGTGQSIDAVERAVENLTSTTDLVKKSGEALDLIVNEVTNTADQVRSIATAAEEQSAASEEISRSLEEINRMADETAAAMQQSSQAVSELAQQSQMLQTLVNELRQG